MVDRKFLGLEDGAVFGGVKNAIAGAVEASSAAVSAADMNQRPVAELSAFGQNDLGKNLCLDDLERVTVRFPNPIVDGIVDVVTGRGLARAIASTVRRKKSNDSFDRAFAKTINLSGAVAEVILNGKR